MKASNGPGLATTMVSPTSTRARAATFRPLIEIDAAATRVLVEQTRVVAGGARAYR
jgi:hypothetical protein